MMSSATDETSSIFSDESSFYGDEEEKSRLEELAETYNPAPYWEKTHPHLLRTIQHDLKAQAVEALSARKSTPSPEPPTTEIQVHPELNASTTHHNSPEKHEPTKSFLARLPPSTTRAETAGPWIYVSNPQRSTPENEDIAQFVAKGTAVLRRFEDKKATLEAEHDRSGAKSKLGLARKLVPLRRTVEREIFDLARKNHVVSGKWMMFLTGEWVDKYWGVVVEETVKGNLGVAAKVATDDGSGSGKARLLAVYTRDFGDTDDVRRVLERLVEVGLVEADERPIYYKCDAYTYLEILGNNSYGLKASLFSSRDVLEGRV